MSILKIARMGHPVLWAKATPVADPAAPEIQRLIADMIETMADAQGVGLAAPQIHVSLRIFVFRVPESRTGADPATAPTPVSVLINPEVTPLGEEMQRSWEGCLSLPGLRAEISRHARLRYRGLTERGESVECEAAGFHAVVIQHENDHLDGILYPMRITDFTRFGFTENLAALGVQL